MLIIYIYKYFLLTNKDPQISWAKKSLENSPYFLIIKEVISDYSSLL